MSFRVAKRHLFKVQEVGAREDAERVAEEGDGHLTYVAIVLIIGQYWQYHDTYVKVEFDKRGVVGR